MNDNMKRHIILATFLAATSSTFIGCTRKGPDAASPATGSAAATKPYPLQTCVVSGEKLGSMGEPVVFVHEGQEIKLCCKECLKDFKADPAKYTKKIEEAQKNKQ